MARPDKLYFMGGITRDPGDHFGGLGVPPRDLDVNDIEPLSDAVLEQIMGTPPFAEGSPYHGPLYSPTKPGGEATERATERDRRAARLATESPPATEEPAV